MKTIKTFKQEGVLLDPEVIVSAIKYTDFQHLINSLPYASPVRVMTLMLAYTGCRVSELSHMSPQNMSGTTIHWKPGKNQKGWRKETLPNKYLEELKTYRALHPTTSTELFGMKPAVYRRHFNCHREHVGGNWTVKTDVKLNGPTNNKNYVLQLKGFRKVFQTVLFAYFIEKYEDAHVAIGMVSRRMRHRAKIDTTLHHYIEAYDKIQADRWVSEFYSEKPAYHSQTKLLDYGLSRPTPGNIPETITTTS